MSYLKLCQISNDNYIEDCNGEVLVNNISFPAILSCEVIDWESEEEYHKRGKILSFNAFEISVDEQPQELREVIYQNLLITNPELIK